MAQTALDLINGALRKINVLAAGEVLSNADAQDALAVLDDLLESLSNEHLACYQRVENIVTLLAGKGIYTIGNPVGGQILGTVVQGSATVSGVTVIPANLVVGGDITGPGIASGATITAIGTNTVTMSLPATATFSVLQPFSYTTPGDFKIQRPLRITNGFSRLTTGGYSSIDYPFEMIGLDVWNSIGIKNLPAGPWPRVCYYDQSFPLGTLYFWGVPTTNIELHLWTDNILTDMAGLSTQINLPQGYSRFLKLALAIELAPEYGKQVPDSLMRSYEQAKNAVKMLNSQNPNVAFMDIGVGATKSDASFIIHGGFS